VFCELFYYFRSAAFKFSPGVLGVNRRLIAEESDNCNQKTCKNGKDCNDDVLSLLVPVNQWLSTEGTQKG